MLYLTTRDNNDAYTAYKALTQTDGPDGGRFVPFRIPEMTVEECTAFADKTFGETVAAILNLFFSTHLTGWDVDFAIGRNPFKLVSMNHRILIAELWHNLESKYSYIVRNLYKTIIDSDDSKKLPTDWFCIAVRIAVIFGLYGEMLRSENITRGESFDVSVFTGDFSAPMAAWYARKMGLPINTVICTHEENSTVWDLIHRGAYNPATADENLDFGIERLIYGTLGIDAVHGFLDKIRSGRIYTAKEDTAKYISSGFFCSVAGKTRVDSIINSVYRTNHYLIDPTAALYYGGLQDYRAKTGESRTTLLLSESSPMDHIKQISDATGVAVDKLVVSTGHS